MSKTTTTTQTASPTRAESKKKIDLYTFALLCAILASVSGAVYFGAQDVQKAVDIYHAKQKLEENRQQYQKAAQEMPF